MDNPQDRLKIISRLTNRAVGVYWMDGLWDLAMASIFLILAVWGAFYTRFVAFPPSTWPAFQNYGRNIYWIGLLVLIIILGLWSWFAWYIVKVLKRLVFSSNNGFANHRFLLPVDRKVYLLYFILYVIGLGILYGFFFWIKGGFYLMSVPFIISPAVMYWAMGNVYGIRRYQLIGLSGLIIAIFLELLLTSRADFASGPTNILNVIPEWGSPLIPCLVWAAMCLVSGLMGFTSHWRKFRDVR